MPEIDLLGEISIAIMVATGFALLAKVLKQPLILAYILAGVVIGPEMGFGWVADKASVEAIAEIGLILLLFTIGLEIDIEKLRASGKSMAITGIAQFVICVGLGLGFALLLGLKLGDGNYDALYLAICLSLSSTMIVVKLLYDKFELATLSGKITLGVLVLQDIWAIFFISIQDNLSDPQPQLILRSFVESAGLILLSILFARYVLSRVFAYIAKSPELVLVSAISWCFVVAGVAEELALSRAMGALIAGVSLSAFPYNVDVIAKVTNIRDFFITLFFVGLGMMIPFPTGNIILLAILTSLFLVLSRFLSVFPVLYLLKNGIRASLIPAINLSQISEFSLVIATLGMTFKHIDAEFVGILTFAFTITSVVSIYMINYSHHIQDWLTKQLKKVGFKDIQLAEDQCEAEPCKKIVFLGFFREASSILAELEKFAPEGERNPLLDEIMVIDFNPHVINELNNRKIKCIYGDVASMDTLKHAHLDAAKIVICSVEDSLLRGTSNHKILHMMRNMAPHIEVMVASNSIKHALDLYQQGADFVLVNRIHSSKDIAELINNSLDKGLKPFRETEIKSLSARNEVLN